MLDKKFYVPNISHKTTLKRFDMDNRTEGFESWINARTQDSPVVAWRSGYGGSCLSCACCRDGIRSRHMRVGWAKALVTWCGDRRSSLRCTGVRHEHGDLRGERQRLCSRTSFHASLASGAVEALRTAVAFWSPAVAHYLCDRRLGVLVTALLPAAYAFV